MVVFTLTSAIASLAALASIASALPAAGGPAVVKLSVCSKDSNKQFDGRYISKYKASKGYPLYLVGSVEKSDGSLFQIFDTFSLYSNQLNVTLENDRPTAFDEMHGGKSKNTAPKGYKVLDLPSDTSTRGFTGNKIVKYKGKKDFETFTMCLVDGIVVENGGAEIADQLLYRTTESKHSTKNCADVDLHILYSNDKGVFPDAPKC